MTKWLCPLSLPRFACFAGLNVVAPPGGDVAPLAVVSPLPAVAFLLVAAAGSPEVVTLLAVEVALSTAAVPLSAVVSLVSPSLVVAPLLASISLPLWAVTSPPLVASSPLAVAMVSF